MKNRSFVGVAILTAIGFVAVSSPAVGGACGSVLIYYGNGGVPPDYFPRGIPEMGNYFELKSYYEGQGLRVDYTDFWPADVAERNLVILLIPGMRDDLGGSDFTTEQVQSFVELLANGGRLALFGDWGARFGWQTQNRLLECLQVGMRFQGVRAHEGPYYQLEPDQLTQGIAYVDGEDFGFLDLTGTAKPLIVNPYGEVVWAVDQIQTTRCTRPGCDVVVLADTNVLDDLQYHNNDAPWDPAPLLNEHWEPLARNLVNYDGVLDDPIGSLLRRCQARAQNHGDYVSCVARGTRELRLRGCITQGERRKMIREAAHAEIGFRK